MAAHRAAGRPRTPWTGLGRRLAIAAAALGVAATAVGVDATSTASYTDQAQATTAATTYLVPSAATGEVQASGTGEFITTRMRATCADPSQMAWRGRDHMTAWGETWNGWSQWSTTSSEPGFTGWWTSQLIHVGMPAEVQIQVRCGVQLWTGPQTQSATVPIVRTA